MVCWRIRNNPGDAIDTAQDVATTISNAPRRLAFWRQSKAHPVEGIDDRRIAIVAIARAFVELDDMPTKDQQQTLHIMLRSKMRCSEEEAQEMEALGRWLIEQCKGPSQAIARLSRRLFKLDGDQSWVHIQDVLTSLVVGELSPSQIDGPADIRRALRK